MATRFLREYVECNLERGEKRRRNDKVSRERGREQSVCDLGADCERKRATWAEGKRQLSEGMIGDIESALRCYRFHRFLLFSIGNESNES